MKISIQELMARSGVAFGTSGARGLATAMTDLVCYAYTKGFLQYLESIGELKRAGESVAVGGDFRPSTDRVMEAVCRAAEDMGYRAVNCGKVPSPAVALFGFENKIPSIMVTGSHIPDDRNGIKFNKPRRRSFEGRRGRHEQPGGGTGRCAVWRGRKFCQNHSRSAPGFRETQGKITSSVT